MRRTLAFFGIWALAFPGAGRFVGEFKDGEAWNGTERNKAGKVLATLKEGARTEE